MKKRNPLHFCNKESVNHKDDCSYTIIKPEIFHKMDFSDVWVAFILDSQARFIDDL